MDFSFAKEQNKFRQEVQDFLEEEIKKGIGNLPVMPGYKALTLNLPNEWRRRAG